MAKPRVPVGSFPVEMRSRSDPPIGNVRWRDEAPAGGWRRNGRKARCVNQGEPAREEPNWWPLGRARALPRRSEQEAERNGPGAKGRRKVDAAPGTRAHASTPVP